MRGQSKGRLDHGLVAQSSRGGGPHAARTPARCGVVTMRSPCAGQRGGTLTGGLVAASWRQGLGLEHHG
jgi:hypothetical protein